jgi:hypothetical protein
MNKVGNRRRRILRTVRAAMGEALFKLGRVNYT